MKCPFCENPETKVTDSRYLDPSNTVKRRRACLRCEKRFTTFETIALEMQVRKRNGVYEQFCMDKLISGINKACLHSKVQKEQIDQIAREIQIDLLENNIEIIDTMTLGEIVLRKLRFLDKIAYIRYASVYKKMQEIDQLIKEVTEVYPEAGIR